MKLNHGLHLAYCAHCPGGDTWEQTFESLHQHTLAVRERVAAGIPFALSLRLSEHAAAELIDPFKLTAFRRWLDAHDCYVVAIDGLTLGAPWRGQAANQPTATDWAAPERLAYTNRLFDILDKILPAGVEGTVATATGSSSGIRHTPEQEKRMRQQLWACIHHIELLSRRSGHQLGLSLSPDPQGPLRTSDDLGGFLNRLQHDYPTDRRIREHLGVHFDAGHFASEFEDAMPVYQRLTAEDIRVHSVRLSTALRLKPGQPAHAAWKESSVDIESYQVTEKREDRKVTRHASLPAAFGAAPQPEPGTEKEWRINLAVPLPHPTGSWFEGTTNHLAEVIDALPAAPARCTQLQVARGHWELLPSPLRQMSVEDQAVAEYHWALEQLKQRGLSSTSARRLQEGDQPGSGMPLYPSM